MRYKLTDAQKKFVEKIRKAVSFVSNGDPLSDAIDDDEVVIALRLLLDIVDDKTEEHRVKQ